MKSELPAGPDALGNYLRLQRLNAGLSLSQLARIIGVDKSYITRIEAGGRSKPAADVLQRIADVLEIDSAQLLAFLGVRPAVPATRDFFRRKYGINAKTADVLARLVEDELKIVAEEETYEETN